MVYTGEWINEVQQHCESSNHYSQRDYVIHFASDEAQNGLRDFLRRYSHQPLEFFQTSNDFQALTVASFQQTIAEYGEVMPLPDGLVTGISEERDHTIKRFVWLSEGIEDYNQGDSFNELYQEAATELSASS